LAGDGIPLAAGRERGAAAADDARVGDLADDGDGTDVERSPQRLVTAGGTVRMEALRIDDTDSGQQHERWRRRG
jgi:hypothetical protein